jgi:hypothetical protein
MINRHAVFGGSGEEAKPTLLKNNIIIFKAIFFRVGIFI